MTGIMSDEDFYKMAICDKICQYPYITDSQEELDYCCETCFVNKVRINIMNNGGIIWPIE